MILMYHKVSPELKSMWWVSPEAFYKQMSDLQAKKIVYLDDYEPLSPDHCVITFDDAYENIFQYAVPILKYFDYPFEIFVIGKCIFDNYRFKSVEPNANFANIKLLEEMVKARGRLQWHTWSHPRLLKLKILNMYNKELLVPKELKRICPEGFNWFAYPYGERDNKYKRQVKKYFKGALATADGSLTDYYDLKRISVFQDTKIKNYIF